LRECAERAMPIDDFERANPIVLHARLGAELARDGFGVTDEAILSAIRKHTVAAATMSPLDEIVYLADGLEPGREFAGRAELLALAFGSLAAAMRLQLTETLAYQAARGLETAPQTHAAIHSYDITPLREKRSA
jgi:predicted HD superfamily hydrolase involved in NAD metabolism